MQFLSKSGILIEIIESWLRNRFSGLVAELCARLQQTVMDDGGSLSLLNK